MKGAMAGPGSTVKASRPVSMSHTRTVPSKRATATSRPSGLTSRENTSAPDVTGGVAEGAPGAAAEGEPGGAPSVRTRRE